MISFFEWLNERAEEYRKHCNVEGSLAERVSDTILAALIISHALAGIEDRLSEINDTLRG